MAWFVVIDTAREQEGYRIAWFKNAGCKCTVWDSKFRGVLDWPLTYCVNCALFLDIASLATVDDVAMPSSLRPSTPRAMMLMSPKRKVCTVCF